MRSTQSGFVSWSGPEHRYILTYGHGTVTTRATILVRFRPVRFVFRFFIISDRSLLVTLRPHPLSPFIIGRRNKQQPPLYEPRFRYHYSETSRSAENINNKKKKTTYDNKSNTDVCSWYRATCVRACWRVEWGVDRVAMHTNTLHCVTLLRVTRKLRENDFFENEIEKK